MANWTENVNGQHKYVFLAAGSSLKGQSDMMKFEKARELKVHLRVLFGLFNSLYSFRNMWTKFAKIIMPS